MRTNLHDILYCVYTYMTYYVIIILKPPPPTIYNLYNIIVIVYAHVTSPSGHEHNSTKIIFQPFRIAAYQRYLY